MISVVKVKGTRFLTFCETEITEPPQPASFRLGVLRAFRRE